MIFIRHYKTDL